MERVLHPDALAFLRSAGRSRAWAVAIEARAASQDLKGEPQPNPFVLATVPGTVGFLTADRVAKRDGSRANQRR